MDFRVLGPVEVATDDGRTASLGGARQRSLLAMLILASPHVVSTDRLVDGIWGDEPPTKPIGTIQVFVHNLRKALGNLGGEAGRAVLSSSSAGYALTVPPDDIDVFRFRQLREEAREHRARGRNKEAFQALDQALGLVRGQPLADLVHAPFSGPEIAALEQDELLAREDAFDLELLLGRHRDAAPRIEELVRANPMRERLWGQLMVALYRSDRQADALSAYAEARDVLAEELGIDPGQALRQLELAVLRQDPALAAPEVAPPPSAPITPRPPAQLPATSSALIGRGDELSHLLSVIQERDSRLITLTGPGGVGKTRLAISVGQQCHSALVGGVRFVGLDDTTTTAEMADQLARDLCGTRLPSDEIFDGIAAALGDEPSLLILDGLEEIANASEPIQTLLDACPGVMILSTSRRPLHATGEEDVAIAPLDVPAEGVVDVTTVAASPSVEFFVERAQIARPAFELTESNVWTIAELCRYMDGLPLAIELAAARIKVLSPEALLERLGGGIDVLGSSSNGKHGRPRSLIETIEWSYGQLDPANQRVCDRLALFQRGFSLEAVEAVCADADVPSVLDALTAIIDAGLARLVSSRVEVRFEQLRTVRAIALGRLASHVDVDDRRELLARWVLGRAKEWNAELDGPDSLVLRGRFEDLLLDLHAAQDWALEHGDPALAVELIEALVDFWIDSGRLSEGAARAEALSRRTDFDAEQEARAALAVGQIRHHMTDWEDATTYLQRALDIIEPLEAAGGRRVAETAATARCYLGNALIVTGEPERGADLEQRALETALEFDFYRVQVVALSILAISAIIGGDAAGEKKRYEERLRVVRRHGDRARVADTLNTLAEIALDENEPDRADALAMESISLTHGVMPPETRDALISLARADVARDDLTRASHHLDRALELCEQTAQTLGISQCLRVGACIASRQADPATSIRLFAVAHALHPSPSGTEDPFETDLAAGLDRARAAMSAAMVDTHWAVGLAMPRDDALTLLRSVTARQQLVSSA
jgi:predicted ATPase/DNA-binding SARP family transcriptional activator